MQIAEYVKSLGTSIKYYYDKLETWKTIVTLLAGACLLYFSFDPLKLLKGFEFYKVPFFTSLAFLILFMAGYRSWKEEYDKNLKEDSITLIAECTTTLTTSWKLHVKFGHLNVNFHFLLRNMKNHPVTIKKIETSFFEEKVNFKSCYKKNPFSPMKIPSVIEPLGTSEIVLQRTYDISDFEYIEQVDLIASLREIESECIVTFISILGKDTLTIPITIDSEQILIDNFKQRKGTGMNGSPIKAALEKRGTKVEW